MASTGLLAGRPQLRPAGDPRERDARPASDALSFAVNPDDNQMPRLEALAPVSLR